MTNIKIKILFTSQKKEKPKHLIINVYEKINLNIEIKNWYIKKTDFFA